MAGETEQVSRGAWTVKIRRMAKPITSSVLNVSIGQEGTFAGFSEKDDAGRGETMRAS